MALAIADHADRLLSAATRAFPSYTWVRRLVQHQPIRVGRDGKANGVAGAQLEQPDHATSATALALKGGEVLRQVAETMGAIKQSSKFLRSLRTSQAAR